MNSHPRQTTGDRSSLSDTAPSRAAPGEILPTPWHNALFSAFVAGIVVYGTGVILYQLIHFDKFDLLLYNWDDAFYYFQIAWNFAEGKFSTFDGGITRTNGYHPLWMFMITPFYWIFDKTTALFAIKALEIMLIAGAVAMVSGAARLTSQPWFLFFATLPVLYSQQQLWGGMESAAALFMLGLFFLAICLYARDADRWTWLLAVVAFALPWVRLEYIVISLTSIAAMQVVSWGRRRSASGAAESLKMFIPLSIPMIAAVAGLLVYFAYNWAAFGAIVPVSGATKTAWARDFWVAEGGYDIARAFRETLHHPVFNLGGGGLFNAAEVSVYLLLVWWLARRSEDREGVQLLIFLTCMVSLATFHIAQFLQFVFLYEPGSISPLSWYYAPGYLMMASIVPIRCFVVIYLVRRFVAPGLARLANILRNGILATGAIVLFTTVDFTEPFSTIDYTSNENSASYWTFSNLQGRSEFLRGQYGNTQIANRTLSEGSVIGSWDAGQFAYFSRFPVVNLDGLVNSWDYYRTIVSTESLSWWVSTEQRLHSAYRKLYRELGITHLANSYSYRAPYDGRSALGNILHVEPGSNGSRGHLTAVETTEDYDAGLWFWEKIQPHFERRAGALGLIVDGRLAWAVARNCVAEDLLFWRWGDSPNDSALRMLNETITGICTDMVLLPKGLASPVLVERANGLVERAIRGHRARIHSDWEVYVDTGENFLVYIRKSCEEEDIDGPFFLHVIPTDLNVLPENFKRQGFASFDFRFDQHGQRVGGTCKAIRLLPTWPVAAIGTGQLAEDYSHRVWEGSFSLSGSADEPDAAP